MMSIRYWSKIVKADLLDQYVAFLHLYSSTCSVDLSLARVLTGSPINLHSFTLNDSSWTLPDFSVGLDRRWATDNQGTVHFSLPFASLPISLRPLPEITSNAKSCIVWSTSL